MDREAAKQYVKGQLENYLQGKGIDTRRLFLCQNPKHPDNKPSMSIDRNSPSGIHAHCFGCGAHYDTFDLIGIDYNLTNEAEIFRKGYELYHLDVDQDGCLDWGDFIQEDGYPTEGQKRPKTGPISPPRTQGYLIDDIGAEKTEDFTDIVKAANRELLSNPKALQYLQGRGLSMETIRAYNFGYDAGGYNHFLKDYPQHQSKSKKASLYRLIIPYPNAEGRYTYFLTEIADRGQVDDYNGKYRKIKGEGENKIAAQIFNERYLQNPPPVIFICEGIYDALSVEEAGGKALAFVGTAHRRFLSLCKKYMPDTTFVISLDNDSSGKAAAQKVKEGLDFLGIPNVTRTAEHGKDFNEALQTDREGFTEYIQQIMTEAELEKRAAEEAEREALKREAAAYQLNDFIKDIANSRKASFVPTGFAPVDAVLDGGLYPGLYIVGAISSLGKTTFCIQIADQVAQQGRDVLIFSLEMARNELIAKSISRLTFIKDLEENGSTNHAKTTRGILTGARYANYSQTEKELIGRATASYGTYARNIYITEGVGNVGIDEIRNKVCNHIRLTGKAPLVVIDYLQIIAPTDIRATDKQNTDKAVLELKRLSRDCSTPVIGISSFNRDNYTAPVNLASFKESGAIEYSSDVLIGLQYLGMDYEEKETDGNRLKRLRELMKQVIEDGKAGRPQKIQVKVLKNRNGSKGSTRLDFYPMFNYFGVPAPSENGSGWSKAKSTYGLNFE